MSFIALAGCWLTEPGVVASAVASLMEKMFPGEEMVWGPAIHMPDPERTAGLDRHSDALAFICRDRASGEYTVVFRGTNTVSATEWLFQDFMVQKQVPWRELQAGPTAAAAPADALVSEGTATAVSIRRELRPPAGFPGEGQSLAEALLGLLEGPKSRDGLGNPCVLRFTGHSLGGLLAPTMALWFLDYLETTERQDLASRLRLEVYAYAGPTPGNLAFSTYLESRLPTFRRYVNALDIAPCAWNEATMASLPGLYKPGIGMQPVTWSLYNLCLQLSKGKGYTHPGEVIAVPSDVVPVAGGLYLLEASYQHVMPYLDILRPERKESIVTEVIEPIARSIAVAGLKPIELEELFLEMGTEVPAKKEAPPFNQASPAPSR